VRDAAYRSSRRVRGAAEPEPGVRARDRSLT
jgi:hypothetical protein